MLGLPSTQEELQFYFLGVTQCHPAEHQKINKKNKILKSTLESRKTHSLRCSEYSHFKHSTTICMLCDRVHSTAFTNLYLHLERNQIMYNERLIAT